MWTQVIWKYFTKNVQIRLIFQTLFSISPNFHVFCLQPNALLESYDSYGSFGTMIGGSLIVSPVLWFLSSWNTLSVTHSDMASYSVFTQKSGWKHLWLTKRNTCEWFLAMPKCEYLKKWIFWIFWSLCLWVLK